MFVTHHTEGKIERWHLKGPRSAESYYLPGDLEAQIVPRRALQLQALPRTLKELTPVHVYFGRDRTSLVERERIKRETIKQRRFRITSKPLQL